MDIRFGDVFGIEEHYEEGCVYDYLEVRDFVCVQSGSTLVQF